jgi:hypothetical protein
MLNKISFKHFLALGLLVPFNLIIWKVLTSTIPVENREILAHTIGVLEGFLSAIVMFHYGDSSGSKRKTEILNEQAQEKQKTINTQLNEKSNNSNTPIDNNSSMGPNNS